MRLKNGENRMKAHIHFQQRNEFTGETEGHKYVATIECGDRDIDEALEYAWLRTNNIHGSWSRGEFVNGEINNDFSEDVVKVVDLPEFDGKVFGHRSSMIGDIFVIDGTKYRVAGHGFKAVSEAA